MRKIATLMPRTLTLRAACARSLCRQQTHPGWLRLPVGRVRLELPTQYNASLAGDVCPEQAVETLHSNLQQIAEEGQAVS